MSYYCYLHGWASPVESCPKCVTVTTSTTIDIPDAELYRRELESACQRYNSLKADYDELKSHLALALSFAPKGPVPEGLAPMFYHTLNYEDECKLQERIDKARQVLAEYEAEV